MQYSTGCAATVVCTHVVYTIKMPDCSLEALSVVLCVVQNIQVAYRPQIFEALERGDEARAGTLRAMRDEELAQLLRLDTKLL